VTAAATGSAALNGDAPPLQRLTACKPPGRRIQGPPACPWAALQALAAASQQPATHQQAPSQGSSDPRLPELDQLLDLQLISGPEGGDVLEQQHTSGADPLQALLEGRVRCVEFTGGLAGRAASMLPALPSEQAIREVWAWQPRRRWRQLAWQPPQRMCLPALAGSHVVVDAPRPGCVYLPGSFNPLHEGHEQLLAAAVAAAGEDKLGCYELSVGNADKVRAAGLAGGRRWSAAPLA